MSGYRNPVPTVDVVIRCGDGVVLVERRNPPPGWAIPGGFVDEGESLEAAALREAREETGLEVRLTEQFFTYSDPRRDPRRHTITTVFLAEAEGTPVGGDDARAARVWPWRALPEPLCFDHGRILADVRRYLETGRRPRLESESVSEG
ncbi:MAG: NUDIX hydrolase [Deferrisomatales bacterium]